MWEREKRGKLGGFQFSRQGINPGITKGVLVVLQRRGVIERATSVLERVPRKPCCERAYEAICTAIEESGEHIREDTALLAEEQGGRMLERGLQSHCTAV